MERQQAFIRGDFIKENLPRIGLEYTSNQTDYQLMKRKDDSRTYGASVSHSAGAFQHISAGYYITDSAVDYDRIRHQESSTYYNTDENTHKIIILIFI